MPKILVSIDGQNDGKTYYERELDLWFVPQPESILELSIGDKVERIRVENVIYQEAHSRVVLECIMDDLALLDEAGSFRKEYTDLFRSDPAWSVQGI